MKTPNQKVPLIALASALGIAAMLTSPALAQQYQRPQHQRLSPSPDYATRSQPSPDVPHYGDAPYDERDDW